METSAGISVKVRDGRYLLEMGKTPSPVPQVGETVEHLTDEGRQGYEVVDREWTFWDEAYNQVDETPPDTKGVSVTVIVEPLEEGE